MIKDNSRVTLLSGSDFGPGRALYISKALESLGLEVTMLTHEPVYQKGQTIYEDMDSLKARIVKIKIPFAKSLHSSLLGRLAIYTVFSFLAFIKLLKFLNSVNVVYSRGPHPFTDFISVLVKNLRKGIKVISDITDLWPESLTFMSENLFSKILQLIGICLNRVVYKRCDYIIVHNRYFKEYVWRIYLKGRTRRNRILVIPHVVDTKEFIPLSKKEAINHLRKYLDDCLVHQIFTKVVVGYSGLISNTIGSDVLLKIFKLFEDDNRIVFLIIGEGPLKQKLVNFVKQNNIRNVVFAGPFPHKLMRYVINLFDITIITSYHGKMIAPSRYWFPKKLVEYAACGKPIVFVGISDFIRTTLKRYSSGISLYPEELKNFRQVFRAILSDYQSFCRNSRRMAEKEFSLDKAREKLKTIIGLLSLESLY